MKIKISTPVGISEIGGRVKQEDAVYPQLSDLSQESRVIVVCDGLGGLELGEVASDTVARAIGRWVEKNVAAGAALSASIAIDAVAAAQSRLNQACESRDTVHSMGTTMTMLVLGSNGAVAAHIGDSRIYHIRPAEKKILYRSRDHSLVNDLFQMGHLTRLETELSPKKNLLTRAMRPAPAPAAQPDVALISDIKAGDYFMLCSDGITNEVSDKKLLDLLARTDMGEAMKIAALQVMAKDGRDNRSVVLVRVEQVEHEPGETLLESNEAMMCDRMVRMDVVPAAAAVRPVHPVIAAAAPAAPAAPVAAAAPPAAPPAVPSAAVDAASARVPAVDEAAVPPPVPAAAQDEAVADEPLPATEFVAGNEETHYDYSKPKKKDYTTLRRAGLILLLGLLLAGGIMAFFALDKPKTETPATPAADSLADPDVSIDSMLPEMPTDSLAVGTDVAVPRAPGIGDVALPNTDASSSSSSSPAQSNYPKGSSVSVSKAPKYNGSNTPPYDPYDGSGGFGSDEPISDDEPAATPAPNPVAERRSTTEPSKQPSASPSPSSGAGASRGSAPQPARDRSTGDPSVRTHGAVPMRSGQVKSKPIETP